MNDSNDAQVEEAISLHYSQSEVSAPDFDDMWSHASNSSKSRNIPTNTVWQISGIAAAVMVVAVLFVGSSNTLFTDTKTQDQASKEQAELFQNLAATTYWRAPSDALLKTQQPLQVWGTPSIDWQTNTSIEEQL